MRDSAFDKAIHSSVFSPRRNDWPFWGSMIKTQFELALRWAGEIARDSDFIVFGSQSILGMIAKPPKNCLRSMELDLYPRHHPQAMRFIIARLGQKKLPCRKR